MWQHWRHPAVRLRRLSCVNRNRGQFPNMDVLSSFGGGTNVLPAVVPSFSFCSRNSVSSVESKSVLAEHTLRCTSLPFFRQQCVHGRVGMAATFLVSCVSVLLSQFFIVFLCRWTMFIVPSLADVSPALSKLLCLYFLEC